MTEAVARRWRRYGKDRLYVVARDGSSLGWHDLVTGETHYADPGRTRLMDSTVTQWRERAGLSATSGTDRLTVSARDAGAAHRARHRAPLDLATQLPGSGPRSREWEVREREEAIETQQEDLRRRDDVLADQERALRDEDRQMRRRQGMVQAIRSFFTGRLTPERQELADRNAQLRGERQAIRGEIGRTNIEISRLEQEARPWRVGAQGEEIVADWLADMVRRDARWRVLHSIPVGDGRADIDHLMIGPAGVYTLNTKHHPGANVFVYYETVMVNGTKYPYVRKARAEARRASGLLSRACGFKITVSGVVVPTGMARFTPKAQPKDVGVIPSSWLGEWLVAGPKVLTPALVEAIYEAARLESTWRA